MLNYNSILSNYDDKLTLMEWLKKVEAALQDASATSFKVNKKGNATISFSVVFADGSELESGDIVLQEGESVESAAIVNGDLILTLTNGDEINAGNLGAVSGFSIDASQHLIVSYQDGTTQDLGAIFSGNVNIAGNLTADSIIENMVGYGYAPYVKENVSFSITYAGAVKNGNKLTLACSGFITRTGDITGNSTAICDFIIPEAIGSNLYTTNVSGVNGLAFMNIYLAKSYYQGLTKPCVVLKTSNTRIRPTLYSLSDLELDVPYLFRFEITFLLSTNFAA